MVAVKRYQPAGRRTATKPTAPAEPEATEPNAETEEDSIQIPSILVLGRVGDRMLVQCSWQESGTYDDLSMRTLEQFRRTGMDVVDEPANYLTNRVTHVLLVGAG